MEGMKDWNEMNTDEYIKHLEQKFMFNSSGTAKAVFELISTYKALTIQRVSQRSELLLDYTKQLKKQGTLTSGQDESKLVKKYLSNNCG